MISARPQGFPLFRQPDGTNTGLKTLKIRAKDRPPAGRLLRLLAFLTLPALLPACSNTGSNGSPGTQLRAASGSAYIVCQTAPVHERPNAWTRASHALLFGEVVQIKGVSGTWRGSSESRSLDRDETGQSWARIASDRGPGYVPSDCLGDQQMYLSQKSARDRSHKTVVSHSSPAVNAALDAPRPNDRNDIDAFVRQGGLNPEAR